MEEDFSQQAPEQGSTSKKRNLNIFPRFFLLFMFSAKRNLDHVFFKCKVAKIIWENLEEWLGTSRRDGRIKWKNFLSRFNNVKE